MLLLDLVSSKKLLKVFITNSVYLLYFYLYVNIIKNVELVYCEFITTFWTYFRVVGPPFPVLLVSDGILTLFYSHRPFRQCHENNNNTNF